MEGTCFPNNGQPTTDNFRPASAGRMLFGKSDSDLGIARPRGNLPGLHPSPASFDFFAMLRHPLNPVLTAAQAPYPATLVFNAGVLRHAGRYVMVFRNDHGRTGDPRFDGTNLGLATSPDGVKWTVEPKPILTEEQAREDFQKLLCHHYPLDFVRRVYDPRLSEIDGKLYLSFAIDTAHGICAGVATTEDFRKFHWLSVSA